MKRWLCVLLPLAMMGGLIFWRLNEKKVAAAAQSQQRAARMKAPPVVSVARAQVRDVAQTFDAVGTVEAPFNVKIAAQATGRIDFLQVREGDRVQRGQVLVRIDPSEIEAQVRQQQAALAEARFRLAQAQSLQAPTDVNVRTQIRQQEATLASARADFDQVRQNYNAQVASAMAAVTDAQGKVNNVAAAVKNAGVAIRSAQANLEYVTTKYNRVHDLYTQGFIAAQDVDDASTAMKVAQSGLDIAKGQLEAQNAASDSATAQWQAAQQQAEIVKTKGLSDIEAARAKVTQAQAALESAKANTAQRPAYQQNLAALKASVGSAEASLRNVEAQRANLVLRSPVNGFVTSRVMDTGAMATAGTPILTVQSVRQVWVTVPVPEEVSRRIAFGQTATLTLDGLPGRSFSGKVVQVNPAADPQSRQFAVRLGLDNAQNLLKPGMFAHVTFVTERVHGAVVVPREALQRGKDGTSVIVVDSENVAQRRPVTEGASDPNGIAIKQGIQPGEQVVTLSAMPVKDGATVRIAGKPGASTNREASRRER
jgi:HlyD family secretion protein